MIKVYPSRLEGEPLEIHQTEGVVTLRAWLAEKAPECDTSLLTIHINGDPAGLDDPFNSDDVVEIWIEPRGFILAAVIGMAVAVAATVLLRPKVPKPPETGRGLQSATLSANSARYGEPIPEVFGSPPRIYPDYLLPPRTYYNGKREQWVEALFCVGKGRFQKSAANVYVGDTRSTSLGNDINIRFYEPGADLSSEPAADWWHSPSEVGFTSRGNAGMELGTISERTPHVNAAALSVSGSAISFPYIGPAPIPGFFPTDWTAGVELRIEVPYPATVTAGPRDVITSNRAFSHFNPAPGMRVELGGDADGVYLVHDYTPASGGSPAVPGSPSMYTASDEPARLDFGAASGELTIAAPAGTYTVFLDDDYADEAELLDAINAQLNATDVVAVYHDGKLRIQEAAAPYTGEPVTVSGNALTDLFGSSPVGTLGTKTEPASPATPASMTLSTLDGLPVTDLPKGQVDLAVAQEGMTYLITERVTSRALRVEPVGIANWNGWDQTISSDIEVSLGAGSQSVGWVGPFNVTPENEACDAFEVDLVFPQGLVGYDKKGRRRYRDMGVIIEHRIGGGPWHETRRDYWEEDPDAIGFTVRVDLPGPSEDVQVRVRTTKQPSTSSDTTDGVQWTGLRGRVVGRPDRYEGVTVLAVRLRTGDRVSSQADSKIWLKATRILPLIEGGEGPTRDLAPALMHVFRECGYGNRVDTVALEELHDIWSARSDHFDMAVESHTTVKRLSNDILRAGFAELVIDRGLLTPVRDALRDQPNYIYSPQEFTDYPTVTTRLLEPDEIDGVDAEYVDEHSGKTETIKYRLLGDEGRRAEKIQLPGVTNWTRAWRLAARHRRALAYRRTVFKGTTELQALNSRYMSYDRIQDGVPEYGQSCFIVAKDGLTLTVSEPLDFGADKNRVIALRQLDGKLTEPVWVERGDDEYQIRLLDELPFAFQWSFGGRGNVDPTMIYFGRVRTWSHEVLVRQIDPKQNGTVDIEAVIYDPRVYADDDRDPLNEVALTTEPYAFAELTSTPYLIELDDETAGEQFAVTGGRHAMPWQLFPTEKTGAGSFAITGGQHRDVVLNLPLSDETGATGFEVTGGTHREVVQRYSHAPEETAVTGFEVTGGTSKQIVIRYSVETHATEATSFEITGGEFETSNPILVAPTGLAGQVYSEDAIRITWMNASNIHIGQNVYRSDSPFDESNLPPPIATGKDERSYIDDGVSEGSTYYYAVATITPDNSILLSDVISVHYAERQVVLLKFKGDYTPPAGDDVILKFEDE